MGRISAADRHRSAAPTAANSAANSRRKQQCRRIRAAHWQRPPPCGSSRLLRVRSFQRRRTPSARRGRGLFIRLIRRLGRRGIRPRRRERSFDLWRFWLRRRAIDFDRVGQRRARDLGARRRKSRILNGCSILAQLARGPDRRHAGAGRQARIVGNSRRRCSRRLHRRRRGASSRRKPRVHLGRRFGGIARRFAGRRSNWSNRWRQSGIDRCGRRRSTGFGPRFGSRSILLPTRRGTLSRRKPRIDGCTGLARTVLALTGLGCTRRKQRRFDRPRRGLGLRRGHRHSAIARRTQRTHARAYRVRREQRIARCGRSFRREHRCRRRRRDRPHRHPRSQSSTR